MFSALQNLNAKKGEVEWEKRRRSAEVLLTFAAAVYKLQVLAGRHFLHEHPAGATSWSHPTIAKLLATSGVSAVVAHQCAFGLQTSTQDGGQAPAMKPTRFMSSAPAILEALSRKCPGRPLSCATARRHARQRRGGVPAWPVQGHCAGRSRAAPARQPRTWHSSRASVAQRSRAAFGAGQYTRSR